MWVPSEHKVSLCFILLVRSYPCSCPAPAPTPTATPASSNAMQMSMGPDGLVFKLGFRFSAALPLWFLEQFPR